VTTPYDPTFEAAFGDGEYRFRLCGLKEWAELEDKAGGPLFVLLGRLQTRQCAAKDIYEPIRLALIGGGMKPADALLLCKRYVVERPLIESWELALRCVASAIFGPEELTSKKADAAGESQPETDG